MSATFENIMDRVEHCYTAKPCVECKYDKRDFPHCVGRLLSDVRFFYKELESRLAQVERERDAMASILRDAAYCAECMHCEEDPRQEPCRSCLDSKRRKPHWQWRGVCAGENT